MADRPTTLGILVGGGPAPGINSVISAATIEARNAGWRVLGILEGFRYLMDGRTDMVRELEIHNVSRIHFTGGSILRISRANPTKDPARLQTVIATLKKLGVDCLVTIGGEGTLYLAHRFANETAGTLRLVHVPKTIDNDIPLPGGFSTFGFQTARHFGVQVVQRIMEDAQTSSRWYFVVTMGRKSGHLALGIGKAAGATVVMVPEEFPAGPIPLDRIADRLEGAILKRLAMGREDGVAVIAEGLVERLDQTDLERLHDTNHDAFGHLRMAEVPFAMALRDVVRKRLEARGLGLTVVAKDLGYELRCADPIPFDVEYTRDLGHGAVRCLIRGESGVMITRTEAHIVPIPLREFIDSLSGRTRIRYVDPGSDSFRVAASYQIRLRPEDLKDADLVRRLKETGKVSIEELRRMVS